jgi:hypothetical protein
MTVNEIDPEDDPMRVFARDLFKSDTEDEDDEPDEQQKPGYVAKEGAVLRPGPDPDKAMKDFVKDLFDNNA